MTVQQVMEQAIQHHQAGRLQQAETIYRQVLGADPNYPDALHFLGVLAHQMGKNEIALELIRRAVAQNPNQPGYYNNLGYVLTAMGRFKDAIAALKMKVLLQPDAADGHNNLGIAFCRDGDADAAIAEFKLALGLKPDYFEVYNNLGNACKDQGSLDEAIEAYRAGSRLNPNDLVVHDNLIYAMHFHAGSQATEIDKEHRRWNRLHAAPLASSIQRHDNDRDPDRILRIGYVGADFREHCQSLFLLPLMANHDRTNFKIHVYSNVTNPDPIMELFKTYCDGWRNIVGIPDEQAARMIREDRIDILIDLTLHMAENRLLIFARKPAPVQASWLGYPSATGLQTMDYRISDPHLDPGGADESGAPERVIRLADTFWCYRPMSDEPGINALPALSRERVTFACLNNFCKVNDGVLELWAKVMSAVRESRLMLLGNAGSYRDRTIATLERLGVEGSRIEFAAKRPRGEYLKLYHQVDLALDTFPYNGHTTSLDAFWMGVPVISLVGKTPVARGGLCLARNLRMDELAVDSPDDFVQVARKLAGDLPKLAEMRSGLRAKMQQSALMDGPRFARSMESVFRRMWRTWCAA
jgi:predicted O-linked N-acetylglucosamine transferase (SPINDLY family)